jgi:redox-sensitive bicupin YhaK (pirin superfamily)
MKEGAHCMIHVYPSESRYHANHGWLKSNFSFSFADHYDPTNMGFGSLRVLNDDWVAPQRGFGMHPHRNMEIVTIVLKGELEHRDNLGNVERMRPGIIQKMTAGRGILHSEMNPSETDAAEFLQLWIEPAESGLSPSYEMVSFEAANLNNQLHPIISTKNEPGFGHIHQDTTLYLSKLSAGHTVEYPLGNDRLGFLFVIEGRLMVNHQFNIKRRDAVRVLDESTVVMTANSDSYLLWIDLP